MHLKIWKFLVELLKNNVKSDDYIKTPMNKVVEIHFRENQHLSSKKWKNLSN